LKPELAELAPKGERRMGANPHANGGLLLRDLIMPDFRDYAVNVPSPGSVEASDAHELGVFLRDVAKLNREQRKFPNLWPRRNAFQSPERGLRGDRTAVGRDALRIMTSSSPWTVASWKC